MKDDAPKPDRKKRPTAERTAPRRDMSSLFGAEEPPKTKGAPRGPEPDPHVASGVGAGYRVIDEYLRQGQEAARAAWLGGLPGLGGLGGTGGRGEAELAAMASQMLRYSTELASFWTAMFNNVSRPSPIGDIPRPPMPGAFDFGGPMPSPKPAVDAVEPKPSKTDGVQPDVHPVATLTLAIDSKRPVEVSARLDPHGPLGKLRVHDLRAASEKLPRLRGVRAELRGGGLWVALKVGREQPAGVYSGVIVDDETNLPAGTLSVQVK